MARPELPPGCWLEAGIVAFGDATTRENCGWGEPSGICNDECRVHARKCVLDSIAARKPFTVVWTNHLVEGVGTRGAVVARHGDAGYEVTWLDYEYVSGFDPEGGGLKKLRTNVKARFCSDLRDVMEECNPSLPALGATCGKGAAKLRDDLWLDCVTAGERPVCSE